MLLCEYNHTVITTGISGTRQIVNTNYGVCVQAAQGYCSIQWTQDPNDSYSFTVSGDTGGIASSLLGKYDNYAGARLVGSCEECDEPLGSIRCREFLDRTNKH